jgi:hypothetical protein
MTKDLSIAKQNLALRNVTKYDEKEYFVNDEGPKHCEAKNGLERIKNLMKKKIFCEVRDLGLRSKKWPRTNKKFDEKENFL